MSKSRESKFELMRIIAILMIIFHHCLIYGSNNCGYTSSYTISNNGITGIILESFSIIGVNLFVLISGWYGITKIWKPISRLLIDNIIYTLISLIICSYFLGQHLEKWEIIANANFMNNWYIKHYIVLILSAPIIERSLLGIQTKTILSYIACLTIINVILGWCLGLLNSNGYNALNFIFLYYIGRALRISNNYQFYKILSKHYMMFFLLVVASQTFFCIYYYTNYNWNTKDALWIFGYNSPLVLLNSIILFIKFSSLKINHIVINYIADKTFGIYLLHTTSLAIIYRNYISETAYSYYGYWGIIVTSLLIFIFCLFIATITEEVIKVFKKKVGLI